MLTLWMLTRAMATQTCEQAVRTLMQTATECELVVDDHDRTRLRELLLEVCELLCLREERAGVEEEEDE